MKTKKTLEENGINPGIVRISRDWKLRVQNQAILKGSVQPEERLNCGEILYGLV